MTTPKDVLTDQTIGPMYLINDVEAERIISALDAAGYVIVPKEPTGAMVTAADKSPYDCREGLDLIPLIGEDGIRIVYRAMIDAAKVE